MTGPFDIPEGMPRIEHAIVDEETQMMRYLAEMAMEDIALLPDPSARKVRPGSLMEAYRKSVAAEHAIEAANEVVPVKEVDTITMYWTETGQPVEVAVVDPRQAVEFKGE